MSKNESVDAASMHPIVTCGFEEAWIGNCKNECPCEKHAALKCVSCGEKATRSCDQTGQFCCGAPLCDDCEHTIAEDGTNGNIGFFRTAKLPDGFREHCKKSEQVYQPWYMRAESCK